MGEAPDSLIIGDGDLPTLVACGIEARRASESGGGGALLVLRGLSGPRAEAGTRMAELLGLEAIGAPGTIGEPPDGPESTALLLGALDVARGFGARRVVWPIQLGGADPGAAVERIARAVDRALLVGRLAALDDDAMEVEAPLVDLSDAQLAQLAFDLEVPVEACWWWTGMSGETDRTRWLAALRAAGWEKAVVSQS